MAEDKQTGIFEEILKWLDPVNWITQLAAGEMDRATRSQQLLNLMKEKYSDFLTPEEKAKIDEYTRIYWEKTGKSAKEKEALTGMGTGGLAQQRTFTPLKQAEEKQKFEKETAEAMKRRQFQAGKKRTLLEQIPTLDATQAARLVKQYKEAGGEVDEELKSALKQKVQSEPILERKMGAIQIGADTGLNLIY